MNMELKLVNKEDKDLVNKAEKFFEPLHQGHTDFQIKYFILKDSEFPLPDSKYYQAMLEIYVRYENLVQQHYDHKKLDNEIKLLGFDIEDVTNTSIADKRKEVLISMKQDEIVMKRLRMQSVEKAVKSTCREIKCFVGCMEELKPQLKYKNYESMQKHHWLLVHRNQVDAGRNACSIPKEMLLDERSRKLLKDVK